MRDQSAGCADSFSLSCRFAIAHGAARALIRDLDVDRAVETHWAQIRGAVEGGRALACRGHVGGELEPFLFERLGQIVQRDRWPGFGRP